MRFHMTTEFSQARETQAAAEQRAEDSELEMEDPAWQALSEQDYDAIAKLFTETPAITPTEVAAKLALFERRQMSMWSEGASYFAAVLKELAAMQGWPVSSRFLQLWGAWRRLDEQLQTVTTGEEEDRLMELRSRGYVDIVMSDCTTPGDFILKQYLRLLTTHGGTDYGKAKEDGTGNPWDVALDDNSDEARFETADKLGTYHDIDATDVGANLLAYGLPYFDAEKWMERANAIGLRVDLVQQQSGKWMFGQCMDLDDDENRGNNPRLRREQDRLRRIIAKDYGGKERISLLGDEIRRNWPQLVRPLPAEALA